MQYYCMESKHRQNANSAVINKSKTANTKAICCSWHILGIDEWKYEKSVYIQSDVGGQACSYFTPSWTISRSRSRRSAVCKCIYAGMNEILFPYTAGYSQFRGQHYNSRVLPSCCVAFSALPPKPPNVSVILFNNTPRDASWKELTNLKETTKHRKGLAK